MGHPDFRRHLQCHPCGAVSAACRRSPCSSCAAAAGRARRSRAFRPLLFFLLDYPVGSLIGTAVFLAFAGVAMLLARPAERRDARAGGSPRSWRWWRFSCSRRPFTCSRRGPRWCRAPRESSSRTSSSPTATATCRRSCGRGRRWPCELASWSALSVLLFNRRWPRPLRMAAAHARPRRRAASSSRARQISGP